jgi:hypothetical protein
MNGSDAMIEIVPKRIFQSIQKASKTANGDVCTRNHCTAALSHVVIDFDLPPAPYANLKE